MRVILVGPPEARARLRVALANSRLDIVGEALTLASARAADFEADGFFFAPGDPAKPLQEPRADDPVMLESLTPREVEVLELLAEGLPNKGIARRLDISDQTVKFHVASIYGKLGASNRTDAVRRALRRGLITI